MGQAMIVRRGRTSGGLPLFTYTGTYQLIEDGGKNWRIKFLTSGILRFTRLRTHIDLCLVGGGGGGWTGGGGGGRVLNQNYIAVSQGVDYPIVIGAGGGGASNGGQTSAFGCTAIGGDKGGSPPGGNGGSGGGAWGAIGAHGGSDGSNGGNNGETPGGTGQILTTREFGAPSGTLYAGGGGGGGVSSVGLGGAGGGGNGGASGQAGSGAVNTGGGGGGSGVSPYILYGSGGSGIAVIRNYRG